MKSIHICLGQVDIGKLDFDVLPKDEEISSGKDAVILWSDLTQVGDVTGVHSVTVVHSPEGPCDHITPRQDALDCSRGNIEAGWMEGHDMATPEAIYGGMVEGGFVSPEEHLRALSQFARIKEAQWARRMLIGMDNVRNYEPQED